MSAVDDIQVLLDDHIIKVQTMRSSPFIKPIETECKVRHGNVYTVKSKRNVIKAQLSANLDVLFMFC